MTRLETLWTNWQPLLIPFAIVLVILAMAGIFYAVVFSILERIAAKDDHPYLKPMVKQWRRPLMVIFLLFMIYLTYPLLNLSPVLLEPLRQVLLIILILMLAWLTVRSVTVFRIILLSRVKIDIADEIAARRIRTQIRILERIIAVIVWTIAISAAIMTFPRIQQLGISILASAGIAGIVIGFAAQKSLENLLAGIQIAFTQPVRIGDTVKIEGEMGKVEEITLTFIVVCLWDLRRQVIPIRYFLDKPIENWTRTSADLLGTVSIYTDLSMPIKPIRDELVKILDTTDLWDKKKSGILVTDTDNGGAMEIKAIISAADAGKLNDLQGYVREKLIEFLTASFPDKVPSTTVELASSPGSLTIAS